MFNLLNTSPFFSNPGLTHQSDHQNSHVQGTPPSDRLVESRPEAVASTRQAYSLSERFSRDDSFSISLMTQDGDKVEITFNSQTRYESDYREHKAGGYQSQRYSINQAQSSEFGFSVDGQLDIEELDAIAVLVQDLSMLAANFFDGDIQAAMEDVGSLRFDDSQLARMDVSMQQSTEYRAIEKYREVQTLGGRNIVDAQRVIEPYREQMLNQVLRTEQYIASAKDFTASLFVELVQHDTRFIEVKRAEQESILEKAKQWVELAITQTGQSEVDAGKNTTAV